jgi:hypothetical protein
MAPDLPALLPCEVLPAHRAYGGDKSKQGVEPGKNERGESGKEGWGEDRMRGAACLCMVSGRD